MAYIGNTATTQAFTPAVDYFNGDGSTVAFTLSKPVASVAQVQAVIENVPQNPGSAYTVSGNTITFTSAPPSGTANIYVYYTSPITQVIAPSQGTVGSSQLQSDLSLTGDLNLPSAGARITGDFSNATVANRVMFQSSTTNGSTVVGLAPNGSSTASGFSAFNNSDPNNSSFSSFNSLSTETRILATYAGTGTYLPMTFYAGGSEKLRILTTGGITFNGDTAAANALDDYEEGTWTPTVLGTSGNPTVGYTQQIGRYTKIGDRVFWQLSVLWNSFSGGSGTIAISLPFAVNSSAYNFPTAVVGYTGGITGTPDSGYTDPNQTGMFLKKNGTGGTTVTPADVGSSGSVFMSGHYQI